MASARRLGLREQMLNSKFTDGPAEACDSLRVKHGHPPSGRGRAGIRGSLDSSGPPPKDSPWENSQNQAETLPLPAPPMPEGRLAFKSLDLARLLLRDNKGDSSILFKS